MNQFVPKEAEITLLFVLYLQRRGTCYTILFLDVQKNTEQPSVLNSDWSAL